MRHGRYAFSKAVIGAAVLLGGWWSLDARSTGVLSTPAVISVGVLGGVGVLGVAILRSLGRQIGSRDATLRIELCNWEPRERSVQSTAGGVLALLAIGAVVLSAGFSVERALTDPFTGISSVDFALACVARFAVLWGLLMALPLPGADAGQAALRLLSGSWQDRIRLVAKIGVFAAVAFAVVAFSFDDVWEWAIVPAVWLIASASWWRVALHTIDLVEAEETANLADDGAVAGAARVGIQLPT